MGTAQKNSRLVARHAYAFFTRSVRELIRDRTALFWALFFPMVLYISNLYLFIDYQEYPEAVHPELLAVTAINYGLLGVVAVSLFVFGRQFVDDLERERYRKFNALSLSSAADFAGRLFASTLFGLFAFGIVIAVSIGYGAEYQFRSAASFPLALVAVIVLILVWIVFGILMAAILEDTQSVTVIAVGFVMTAFLVTGFNGGNPEYFAPDAELLNLLPVTLPTRVLIHHLVDVNPGAVVPEGVDIPSQPGAREYFILVHYGILAFTGGLYLLDSARGE